MMSPGNLSASSAFPQRTAAKQDDVFLGEERAAVVLAHGAATAVQTEAKRGRRQTKSRNPPPIIDGTTVQCSFEATTNEVMAKTMTDVLEWLMQRRRHVAA